MDFGKPIEEIKGEAPAAGCAGGLPVSGTLSESNRKCGAEKPKLQQIGADHEVACHLFDKEDK